MADVPARKLVSFDPYLNGYLAGRAWAQKHGPIDPATLRKLEAIADDLRRVVGRVDRLES